jgi:hypothetical protein
LGSHIAAQEGELTQLRTTYNQPQYTSNGVSHQFEGLHFPLHTTVVHSGLPGILPPTGYHGVAGCIICKGAGYIKPRNDRALPCPDCVKDTRYCAVCNNTGYRIYDKKKKCKCIFSPKK